MTVMFQIVEDECPSTRERFSGPLVAFHNEYFPKDPEMQPSVEKLFEHEWLKNYWSLSKDLRLLDSIPFHSPMQPFKKRNRTTLNSETRAGFSGPPIRIYLSRAAHRQSFPKSCKPILTC